MNPFKYESIISGLTTKVKKRTSLFTVSEISFKSAIDTGYKENSHVIGDFYLPKSDKPVPLAILVHGMGDLSIIPFRYIAGHLAKQGIACFLPYLTIHSRRIPKPMKEHMPYLSPEEWFNVYRLSVIDVHQIVDWAFTRKEIDTTKIFISGISFGGFVSSIAMGLDERIKAGVLIVTGGNANKLSWLNKEGQYRKRYMRTEEEHLAVMEKYSMYLDQVERYGFENVPTNDLSFLTDPLTFASCLRTRPVYMINAKNDKYIPVETAIDLWNALGKPDIKWFSSGHVSLWIHYKAIRTIISDFFGMLLL